MPHDVDDDEGEEEANGKSKKKILANNHIARNHIVNFMFRAREEKSYRKNKRRMHVHN